MGTFAQDLRSAFRQLTRNAGSTILAVFTLALGIGATTAIVSVVDMLMLRELPYPEADRIVTVWQRNAREGVELGDVAPANYLEWKDRTDSFEFFGAAEPFSMDLIRSDGRPENLFNVNVTEGFFEALGTRPIYGRLFTPDEYQLGGPPVIIISYQSWQGRFGANPNLVGSSINLDGVPFEVVGILPPYFQLGMLNSLEPREAWIPRALQGWEATSRMGGWWNTVARLKPGVSLPQARADLDRVSTILAQEFPASNTDISANLVPLHDHLLGEAKTPLLILLGAAGLVLLIGCANVSNLLLARGAEREGEFAVRSALGALRGRLIRQLLTESTILGLVGAGAGMLIAFWGVDIIKALSPGNIPRMDQVVVDLRVLGFGLGLAMTTAIVFGVVPALHFSRPDLQESLKEVRSSGSAVRLRLRRSLIVAETALAVTLTVGAGLLIRSFVTLTSVDPGFEQDNVAALQVFAYADTSARERAQFFVESLANIRALPGVAAAGAVEAAPFLAADMAARTAFTMEGEPAPVPGEEPQLYLSAATPGYFATVGIPLLSGRALNAFDRPGTQAVGVINEYMKNRFWPSDDPIGRRVLLADAQAPIEIVGVVGDVRHTALDTPPRPELFVPHAQRPTGSMTYFVRGTGDVISTLGAAQEEIWALQPLQSFYQVSTVDDLIAHTLAARRFSMLLLTVFAAIAVIMAAGGIYSVISFSVNQRTREVALRMALGAERGDVLSLVVREGILVTAVGVAIGVIGAMFASQVVAAQLFGIPRIDMITYGVAAVLLLGIAALASYVPARRAARVEPMAVLRYE